MNLTKVEAYEALFPKGTIVDGITNAHKYFNTAGKYRIAWFLKEAYTTEDEGFHMRKYYSQPDAYNQFFSSAARTTWHPIIYCSYGILNGFKKWENMPYIKHQPEMCDVVNKIAIINANKYPSKTGTYTLYKNLDEGFETFKDLIEQQVKVLDPTIHIFCGTFYLYKDVFKLTDEHLIKDSLQLEACNIYKKNGKLFLEVYHPANRKQKKEQYVDQIVTAVEKWL